jgi:hypothetical protein
MLLKRTVTTMTIMLIIICIPNAILHIVEHSLCMVDVNGQRSTVQRLTSNVPRYL